MEIGKRILEMRLKKGLTQSQLADMLDKSLMTISNWECGKANPHRKNLAQLADILKCSEQYILYGDNGDTETNNQFNPSSISERIKLLSDSLFLSENSANTLFDACLYSMGNIDLFLKNTDFSALADCFNDYMYYCSLEKDSSIVNKELIIEKKSAIITKIISIMNNAAASCDSSEIRAIYKDSINNVACNAFYMPNLNNSINQMMQDSKLYSLLKEKQFNLIFTYLSEHGYDVDTISNYDFARLIGILIDAYWKDDRNADVLEYKSIGSSYQLYHGEDLTEQLRQYASQLYDDKIVPALKENLSDKVIIEHRDLFLENIDIHSCEYNPYISW